MSDGLAMIAEPMFSPTDARGATGYFKRADAFMLGIEAATILNALSNNLDWLRREKRDEHLRDDRLWYWHSVAAWHKNEFGFMSKRTLIRKLNDLEKYGLIIKTDDYVENPAADPNRWYTIDYEQYGRMVAHWNACGNPAVHETKKHKRFIANWIESVCQNVTPLNALPYDKMSQAQGESLCQDVTLTIQKDKNKQTKDKNIVVVTTDDLSSGEGNDIIIGEAAGEVQEREDSAPVPEAAEKIGLRGAAKLVEEYGWARVEDVCRAADGKDNPAGWAYKALVGGWEIAEKQATKSARSTMGGWRVVDLVDSPYLKYFANADDIVEFARMEAQEAR